MGWKIIEIEKQCFLKTFNNNLIIFDTKRITIPMNDIDVLIISNNQINLSVNAINSLVNNGVCVILCNEKYLPNSFILGYKVQKQSYANFKKQLEWTNTYKEECWNWILNNKINNQLTFLKHLNIDITSQENNYKKAKTFIDNMIEANIANFFFKQLYGEKFNRKKDNIINSILNYGYVILTNMVARSLAKKGLNLFISFYHGSLYSDFPLAYDIVEIFRITIDLFVKTLYDTEKIKNILTLNRQIKSCLIDYIANYKIKIDDKYEFINNSIDKVIDWIIGKEFNNHKIEYDFELELTNYDQQQEKLEN